MVKEELLEAIGEEGHQVILVLLLLLETLRPGEQVFLPLPQETHHLLVETSHFLHLQLLLRDTLSTLQQELHLVFGGLTHPLALSCLDHVLQSVSDSLV